MAGIKTHQRLALPDVKPNHKPLLGSFLKNLHLNKNKKYGDEKTEISMQVVVTLF